MAEVAFIGLGTMGESMCARIIAGGFRVRACDIDPAKVVAAAALGAAAAARPSDAVRGADFTVIMVPNGEHVTAVIDDALPHLAKGSLVIDMSTISPVVSRAQAARVRETGADMIDAPVVKSKAAAVSGDLGILVGGDVALFDRALPVLRCMGKTVIHMGPQGSGLVMKICHNMLVAEIQNGVNESLALALRAGLRFDDVIRAVGAGGGQNFYLDTKAPAIREGDFSPKFAFRHMHKDLLLAEELERTAGAVLPGAALAREVYRKGMERGLGDEDFSASFKVVGGDPS